jgi:TP901 family phage tail tape measure protein
MPDFNIRVIVDPAKGVTGVKRVQSELRQTERLAGSVGRKIAAALAAAFAGFSGVAALKTFSAIEQGLLGVAKTADLTARDIGLLRNEIIGISRDLPFARTELLAIAQAAGQLGVKGVANLALFAETIAKLGTASDIAGAEAATALVRILNVTGEGVESVDTLASVIVALGNNFATGEAQILRMGNEVARATALFGVSSTEAVALGTAMKSMGIRAELGGSSVGRAFFAINAAIDEGGESLAHRRCHRGFEAGVRRGRDRNFPTLSYRSRPARQCVSDHSGT